MIHDEKISRRKQTTGTNLAGKSIDEDELLMSDRKSVPKSLTTPVGYWIPYFSYPQRARQKFNNASAVSQQ